MSNRGRVKSIPRRGGNNRLYGGGLLKLRFEPRTGYPIVQLRNSGAYWTARIHVLIAAAFIGPRPDGREVRHLDGNPAHNFWPENLVYGTHHENVRDIRRHGRNRNANKTHCPHGHPYDEANTYVNARGARECRTCIRIRQKRRAA